MSRCGSTLVSRLLASLPRVLVLSEPAAVYRLLEAPPSVPEEKLREWLRDLVLVLGRPRRSPQIHSVFKLSSVLTCHFPRFQAAFPGIPWLFVYRRPEEVMVSVLEGKTGFRAIRAEPERAARWLGMDAGEVASMSDEEYVARVLGRICEAALEAAAAGLEGRGLLEHPRLPQAVWEEVAPLFGLPVADAERQAMLELSRFHAKDPSASLVYEEDSDAKGGRASPAIRLFAARFVAPAFERLHELDRQRKGG